MLRMIMIEEKEERDKTINYAWEKLNTTFPKWKENPYLKEKGLKIGDHILIQKAGDVIPEVVRVLKERRNGTEKEFQMLEYCPICHTKIVRKDTEADYYCPNEMCPARKIENIIHFASREAMNIDGLGESIIEDLYNENFIINITDIYDIDKYEEELMNLEGYGKKKIDNLKSAIKNSKNNSLERLIFGLGIRNVGAKTAKVLAKYYKTLDNLMTASYEELVNISDIGDIIAKSIINYFSNEDNKNISTKIKEIEKIINIPCTLTEFDENTFENFVEKIVVGEVLKNGEKDPNVIRFILKTGSEFKIALTPQDVKTQNVSFGSHQRTN